MAATLVTCRARSCEAGSIGKAVLACSLEHRDELQAAPNADGFKADGFSDFDAHSWKRPLGRSAQGPARRALLAASLLRTSAFCGRGPAGGGARGPDF